MRPPQSLELDQCDGFRTSMRAPQALYTAETHPEWRPSSTNVGLYGYTAFVCQRISVGHYERGPITIIFETHRFAQPPSSCLAEGERFRHMLHRILLSDADLMTPVQQVLRAPTSAPAMELRVLGGVAENTYELTWFDHGGVNHLAAVAKNAFDDVIPGDWELFHIDLATVTHLNWVEVYKATPVRAPTAWGALGPETLHHQLYGNDEFVGGVDVVADLHLLVTSQTYGDFKCVD